MPDDIKLQQVVDWVAPEQWVDREIAIAVRDREFQPPPGWRFQVAADVDTHIKGEMANLMRLWNTDDLTVVAYSHLRINTGHGLISWQAKTPDWSQKLAAFRVDLRDDYERTNLALVRGYALGVVMRAHIRTLDEEINTAVRKVVTAPEAVVSAAPEGGEPRKIRRVDMLNAAFDIKANRLTIGGVVFDRVGVELPAAPNERTTSGKVNERNSAALAALAPMVKSWATVLNRAGTDVSIPLAKKQFSNLTERAVRKVLKDNVPAAWRAQRGTAQVRKAAK